MSRHAIDRCHGQGAVDAAHPGDAIDVIGAIGGIGVLDVIGAIGVIGDAGGAHAIDAMTRPPPTAGGRLGE